MNIYIYSPVITLLGVAAPCFTKRPEFPYGIDKSTVDGLIQQTYTDRPSILKNFSQPSTVQLSYG
ncbi:MAG TPA: hypothetical protein VJ250_01940, partial [Nitrososphaeraceae archaeon]|nr:hypothetical protein [Nitrososphaeraceae archaeon]